MDTRKESIENMILKYLSQQPDPGDTIEGISRWWLGLERTWHSESDLDIILDSMIRKGLIRKHFTADDTILYKIVKKFDL